MIKMYLTQDTINAVKILKLVHLDVHLSLFVAKKQNKKQNNK